MKFYAVKFFQNFSPLNFLQKNSRDIINPILSYGEIFITRRSSQNRILGSNVTLTWHEHRVYVVRAHLLPTAELLFRYSRNGNANAIEVLQLSIDAGARRELYVHVMSILQWFLKFYFVKILIEWELVLKNLRKNCTWREYQ